MRPILFLLASVPSSAAIYNGNPEDTGLCSFMDPSGPQTKWDGNDPPAYQAPSYLWYVETANATEFATVSYYCDRSWASVLFGSDENPGTGVKRKILGHSSGNGGVEDDAECWVTHGGSDWIFYEFHLRN